MFSFEATSSSFRFTSQKAKLVKIWTWRRQTQRRSWRSFPPFPPLFQTEWTLKHETASSAVTAVAFSRKFHFLCNCIKQFQNCDLTDKWKRVAFIWPIASIFAAVRTNERGKYIHTFLQLIREYIDLTAQTSVTPQWSQLHKIYIDLCQDEWTIWTNPKYKWNIDKEWTQT